MAVQTVGFFGGGWWREKPKRGGDGVHLQTVHVHLCTHILVSTPTTHNHLARRMDEGWGWGPSIHVHIHICTRMNASNTPSLLDLLVKTSATYILEINKADIYKHFIE